MYSCKGLFLLLASVSLIGITGCSAPVYQLSEAARPHIHSTDVILGVSQQEINADIERSQLAVAMGGGLIPALIDASIDQARAEKGEVLLQPIRNELADYDFPSVVSEAMEASLTNISWLHCISVVLDREMSEDWVLKHVQRSDSSAVLFIVTTYEFTPKFTEIQLTSRLFMVPNNEELAAYREDTKKSLDDLTAKGNSIYRNDNLVVTEKVGTEGLKMAEAAKKCAENHAETVRLALNNAAQEMAKLIAKDLEKAGNRTSR